MPYISINTSKDLSAQQKADVKSKMGEIIPLIPGKSEAVTMVDISGGHSLYKSGRELKNGAFIEIRLWGKAELNDKDALTKAIFVSLKELLGSPEEEIYLNIIELENWGYGGRFM
jgi:phenylpyruvate tautomerase PptA (4-oxalocrotonate tautomerase family)